MWSQASQPGIDTPGDLAKFPDVPQPTLDLVNHHPGRARMEGAWNLFFFLSFPGNSDMHLCLTATKLQRDRLYLQAHHGKFLF